MPRASYNKGRFREPARQYVLNRDGYRCRDCGKPSERFEVHHIIPVYKGGTGEPANLVTLCVPCHLGRHRKIQEVDKEETLTEWDIFCKELENAD